MKARLARTQSPDKPEYSPRAEKSFMSPKPSGMSFFKAAAKNAHSRLSANGANAPNGCIFPDRRADKAMQTGQRFGISRLLRSFTDA